MELHNYTNRFHYVNGITLLNLYFIMITEFYDVTLTFITLYNQNYVTFMEYCYVTLMDIHCILLK